MQITTCTLDCFSFLVSEKYLIYMTSFFDYINNAVIKLQIYFNSHIRIVWQIKGIIPMRFHLYRTVIHTNIKIFAPLHIHFLP
jgi:glycerol-3-phosphate dehydrogenase